MSATDQPLLRIRGLHLVDPGSVTSSEAVCSEPRVGSQ